MTETTKSTRVGGHKVRQFVQNRQPFHNSGSNHRHPKGSTLWGYWVTHPDTDPVYMVFSYRTSWPLFAYWKGVWFKNEDKYSRTTSKHSGQAHPLTQCVLLSRLQMELIYIGGQPSIAAMVEAAKLKLLSDPNGIALVTKERITA